MYMCIAHYNSQEKCTEGRKNMYIHIHVYTHCSCIPGIYIVYTLYMYREASLFHGCPYRGVPLQKVCTGRYNDIAVTSIIAYMYMYVLRTCTMYVAFIYFSSSIQGVL